MKSNFFGEVDSVEFAIYLSEKAIRAEKHINVTKIQKLLYICYGLYLAHTKKQLLNERPAAWYYGPFFPRVHKAQRNNGGNLATLFNTGLIENFEKYDYIIEPVLNVFGDWSAGGLVEWTHEENTAWDKKYRIQGEKHTSLDSLDIIADFEKFIVTEEASV